LWEAAANELRAALQRDDEIVTRKIEAFCGAIAPRSLH